MWCVQESALSSLQTAVESFERPAFPCALIAGDVVILHLLSRLGYLSSGHVPIVFVDTFHLFEETHAFLRRLEAGPQLLIVTIIDHYLIALLSLQVIPFHIKDWVPYATLWE